MVYYAFEKFMFLLSIFIFLKQLLCIFLKKELVKGSINSFLEISLSAFYFTRKCYFFVCFFSHKVSINYLCMKIPVQKLCKVKGLGEV